MTLWAIVPAKPFEEGKSRLASVLSIPVRRSLNERFFRRTLEITAAVLGRQKTLVISRSFTILQIARSLGVEMASEGPSHGLNEALEQASSRAVAGGATAVLSLSCDLPFLEPDDLRAMIATRESGGMTIAGDHSGTGTNALLISPPGAISYRYGSGSFTTHLEAAKQARLGVQIIRCLGLSFDVDTPKDFELMQTVGLLTSVSDCNTPGRGPNSTDIVERRTDLQVWHAQTRNPS